MIDPKFVMIPAAYKKFGYPQAQKVYSILPSASPNADFSAGRNSSTTAYVTPEDGILEPTTDMRLDWQDRKTCPVLWLERTATNRLLYSDNIASGLPSTWQITGVSTNSPVQDPTNQNKGIRIVNNNTVTTGDFGLKQQFWGSYGYNAAYATVSVYVKRNEGRGDRYDKLYIRLKDDKYPDNHRLTMEFDYNTELLTIEDSFNWTPERSRVIKADNGWYRLELTVLTSGYNTCTFEIQPLQTVGSIIQIALPMAEIIPYNGYLSPQALSHSYIATSGSAVTQGYEFCYDAENPIFEGNPSGSLFIDLQEVEFNDVVSNGIISISTDDNEDAVQIQFSSLYQLTQIMSIRGVVIANGNNVAQIDSTGYDRLDPVKIVATWDIDFFKLYINGVLIQTISDLGEVPLQTDRISFSDGDQSSNFFGKVNGIQYFDEVISESDAIQLTTI
jgi:hypothetical protein